MGVTGVVVFGRLFNRKMERLNKIATTMVVFVVLVGGAYVYFEHIEVLIGGTIALIAYLFGHYQGHMIEESMRGTVFNMGKCVCERAIPETKMSKMDGVYTYCKNCLKKI